MVQAGQAETLCVHGDTQGAAAILQEIVRQLKEAGITPKALSTGKIRGVNLYAAAWLPATLRQ